MAFPFEITPAGKVAAADGVEAMLQQVSLVVSTSRGSRAMRPDFGSDAPNRVFETLDSPDDIKSSITAAVEQSVEGAKVFAVDLGQQEEVGVANIDVYVGPENEVDPRVYTVSLSFGRVVEETVQ